MNDRDSSQTEPKSEDQTLKTEREQPGDQVFQTGSSGVANVDDEDKISLTSVSTLRKGKIYDKQGNVLEAGKRLLQHLITPRKIKKARQVDLSSTVTDIINEVTMDEQIEYGEALLSSIYEANGLRTSTDVINRYTEFANSIDLATATPEQLAFVQDFMRTMARIQQDKVSMPKNIEIDQALFSLPKSLNSGCTIKRNELVITPEIFDGQSPRPRR